ncbi:hypothetical protein BX600DRAFT_438664 [Xylariales sp. PMI_506]|nr:hypothetical protein BX600DRAFT_438664 [Xylariales sp. PMI_506]
MFSECRPVVIIALAALLAAVWSFRLLLVDVPDAVSTLIFGHDYEVESVFIQKATEVEYPAPIDYKPIQEVCSRAKFRPGLLFTCEGQHGGIGMVRMQMLRCIRYAIHGGGAIVVPSMALRNGKDITDIETNNEVPMEYLMDREAFVARLTEGCPGLKIYDRKEDFPFYNHLQVAPLDVLGSQFEPDHPREGLQHPGQWRSFFDAWLSQKAVRPRTIAPVHVRIGQSFLEYPVRYDGDGFAHNFGKILSFRNDTRALAAKVLYELRQWFQLPIDPSVAINPGAYYGAHLRLEKDAIGAWPPSDWRYSRTEDQFEEQFRNIERAGLSVVYVASGDQGVVDQFAEALNRRFAGTVDPTTGAPRNFTVVTKRDLLKGDDLETLNSFTFDQQALVDFMVMFKASAFMGVAHSSFPWSVALRRHELSRYTEYGNEGSDLLRDEYSVIMGMEADYPYVDPFVYGIWP